jgi:beta-1,4-mannosyl-glycoprotein beta-1,4-N-acetylglucosaminyltransferase
MKIIDSFTFFNEIDLLKMRLSLLYEKVDHFIICESNVTHSGMKKNFNYLEYKNDFLPWQDKIIYLKFEPDVTSLDFSYKDVTTNYSSPTWYLETRQRNFLTSFLKNQDPGDVAIVTDVDEIWNPNLSDFLKTKKITHEARRLEMKFHYYYLNCEGVGLNNSKWNYPFFSSIDFLLNNKNLSQIRTEYKLPIVGNAGWHFSYLGGPLKVSEKISAFAHQETNTKEINNLNHLNRCINRGIDHLGREGHDWAFRPIDYYPEYLKNEMLKYKHLIKMNLI